MQDPLKILVAVEDALDRLPVKQAIIELHPEAIVQEVASRAEAAAAIRSQRFDCLFLDDHFSNGLGFLTELREAGNTAPVIMLTNHGDEKFLAEALEAGAADFLPKSGLTPLLLDHCRRSALRFHQAQEQIAQAQEQVKRAQEHLHLRDRAIAVASSGIIISDPHQPDCPIIYCNPAFTSITGYPSEEALGRNCRFLQGNETDAQSVQQMRDRLRGGGDCHVVLRNYKKDGTPFWNELMISPVLGMDGTATHFIGVQTDITPRRNAEEDLRQNEFRQQTLLRGMFASVTEGKLILCAQEDDLPPPLVRFADPIELSATGGIRELRRHTVSACAAVDISEARRFDLETAVGEAAMNAVVHAGTGQGHVFMHERGTVQVRVEDEGRGIAVADLPNATLQRGYSTAGTLGHGFKMILKTVDKVHLLTGDTGTIVVIEQDRVAMTASW